MSEFFSEKDRELVNLPIYKYNNIRKIRNLGNLYSKLTDNEKKNLSNELKNSNKLQIPNTIFHNSMLGPLESVVFYLKEKKKLSYKQIGVLLNKDFKSIGVSYRHAKKKFDIQKSSEQKSKLLIPVAALSNNKFSILENMVAYLKDESKYKTSEIADLLNRKLTTIYTVYSRYKNKGGKFSKKIVDRKIVYIKELILEIACCGQTYEEILESVENYVSEKSEPIDSIPLAFFSKLNLTVFETLTKYLRENKCLSYKEIGKILGRGETSIGITYRNGHKKKTDSLTTQDGITIPFSIFNNQISFLESIVSYLKLEQNMKLVSIAQILNRKSGTIRKAFMNYRRKIEKS